MNRGLLVSQEGTDLLNLQHIAVQKFVAAKYLADLDSVRAYLHRTKVEAKAKNVQKVKTIKEKSLTSKIFSFASSFAWCEWALRGEVYN